MWKSKRWLYSLQSSTIPIKIVNSRHCIISTKMTATLSRLIKVINLNKIYCLLEGKPGINLLCPKEDRNYLPQFEFSRTNMHNL